MPKVSNRHILPVLGRRSEQLLADLKAELDEGVHMPHSRFPTEQELSARFDASRTTVRRALARLAAEGRIEVVQGSGSYVLPVSRTESPSCTLSVMFPFDSGSLAHVQELALDRGYLISVFAHCGWSPTTERKFLERVLQERHRALLAFCTPLPPRNDDLLEELERTGVRVIHVEHYRQEPPERNFVLPDYRRGAAMAANALMIAGYGHFRYIEVEGDGPHAAIAREGFVEALQEQRDAVDPDQVRVVLPANFEHCPEGVAAWQCLLAGLPGNTGILVRTTKLAGIVAGLLRRDGYDVPGDIGIIGMQHLLNYRAGGDTDQIDYDWEELLKEAVEAAVTPVWKGIRAWARPRLVRQGTVRTGGGCGLVKS